MQRICMNGQMHKWSRCVCIFDQFDLGLNFVQVLSEEDITDSLSLALQFMRGLDFEMSLKM